jgi:uncharacterized protein YjiS (DUF1127 family)
MQVHARSPGHDTGTALGIAPSVKDRAVVAVARLLHWHELARQRRALLRLDDRMLKDIGISRADAEHEACRPFWRDGT